jgi:hypothetical protein
MHEQKLLKVAVATRWGGTCRSGMGTSSAFTKSEGSHALGLARRLGTTTGTGEAAWVSEGVPWIKEAEACEQSSLSMVVVA